MAVAAESSTPLPRPVVPERSEVALLDRDGVIVAVDEGWQEYCRAHHGDPAACGVGVSYLDVCDGAPQEPAAVAVASAIRSALDGAGTTLHRLRMPRGGPGATEWFDVVVASRFDEAGACIGAAIMFLPLPVAPGAAEPPATAAALPLDAAEILDTLSDGVTVVDAGTGRRLYVNQAVVERTGYSRQELASQQLGALTVGADAELLAAAIRRVSDGWDRVVSVDIGVRGRSGDVVPVEARLTYHAPRAAGGPGYVVAVTRDLRERLAAHERMRISEESFRAAFDQAPIGMAVNVLHPDGRRTIARANAALGGLLGVAPGDLTGRDMAEFADPEEELRARQATRAFLASSREYLSLRRRYRRPDGRHVWADVSMFPVDFPAAEGVTALAHLVDVTRTRELEIARLRLVSLAALGADITAMVAYGASPEEVYARVVGTVQAVFEARGCALLMVDPRRHLVTVSEARGEPGWPVPGRPRPDQARALLGVAGTTRFGEEEPFGGPAVVARFPHDDEDGLLLVNRRPGAEEFGRTDEELLEGLATRVAAAVQLGLAREGQERVARLEERRRIARDLHDTVIQDLIALGMRMDAEAAQDTDPDRRAGRLETVDELETVVRRLREAIFALGGPSRGLDAREALQEVVDQAVRVLGFRPRVHVTGPLDEVDAAVGRELVAVLREALSNVARHARGTAATVRVRVGRTRLSLTVEDDGVGPGPPLRHGSGLANVRERARNLGGESRVEHGADGGTRLRWTVPLGGPRDRAAGRPPQPEHVSGPRSQFGSAAGPAP